MLIHPPKIVLKNICVKQEMQLMKCRILLKTHGILSQFLLEKPDPIVGFFLWMVSSFSCLDDPPIPAAQPGVSRSGPCKSLRRRDGDGRGLEMDFSSGRLKSPHS